MKKTSLLLSSLLIFSLFSCENPQSTAPQNTYETIENFCVKETGMTWATLSWNENSNYDKYEIQFDDITVTLSSSDLTSNDGVYEQTLKNLDIDTEYKISLYGYANNLKKAYSTLKLTTKAEGPAENFTASVSNVNIFLSWETLTGSHITKLELYRKTQDGDYTKLDVESSTLLSSSYYTDKDIIKNETYTYKLVTYNSKDEHWDSSEVTICAEIDNLNFTVTKKGMTFASLEWDNDSRYDNYTLENSSINTNKYINSSSFNGKEKITIEINKLTANSSITFTLKCYNSYTLLKTLTIETETNESGPVEGLEGIVFLGSSTKITWNDWKSSTIKSLNIYRLEGEKYILISNISDKSVTSYYDYDYTGGTSVYKVESLDSEGISLGESTVEIDTSNYCRIIYEYGVYGHKNNENSYITHVSVDEKISYFYTPDIKSNYQAEVLFSHFYISDSSVEFDKTQSVTSDLTLKAAYKTKTVTNLEYKAHKNSIHLNWANSSNNKIKIVYLDSDNAEATAVTINDIDTNLVELTGLTNGHTYNIKIYYISNYDDILESYKELNIQCDVTKSEWLVIMYLDGDNNLNDPIYIDLNEAEYGLYQLSETDSVKVVALWDGWDFVKGNETGETSYFKNTAATKLLELGKDNLNTYSIDNTYNLSSETKDYTKFASWITDNEVDMSSEQTLENFINWVNDNYSADHTILQFSNHGGGPRSVSLYNKEYGRRSMCWDESSGGQSFLKTSDVSKALKACGFGQDNKLTMIMEDVCLGGSLEECYELKDYAEYYIGSPNNIPGLGFDYTKFISSLKTGESIKEIGANLVYSYKSDYEKDSTYWTNFFTQNGINSSAVSNTEGKINVSCINTNCTTLSFINLSKIDEVKLAVDELATLILNDNTQETRIKKDSDGKYYILGADGKYYYDTTEAPESAELISRREAIKLFTALAGDPIFYQGTFGCLKDLGFMIFNMKSIYTEEAWPDLYTKCDNVTSSLNNALIACWRDGYYKPTYYKINSEKYSANEYSSYFGTDSGFGLTINCSVWVPKTFNGQTYRYEGFEDWYENELEFGKNSTWTALIKAWFNE